MKAKELINRLACLFDEVNMTHHTKQETDEILKEAGCNPAEVERRFKELAARTIGGQNEKK
jgi:hypothetical protein